MALTTEEATAFIKGKSLSATRLAGGTPSLQFKDKGTLCGKNGNDGGGSDSDKWRVEDGKLCMRWQRWEDEGCGQRVRVEGKVQHLYPNANAMQLVFTIKTKIAMYSVANCALNMRDAGLFTL